MRCDVRCLTSGRAYRAAFALTASRPDESGSRQPAMRSTARSQRRLPRRTATSSEGSWPSEKPPDWRENADCSTTCINPQQCGNRQKPTPIIAWALPPPAATAHDARPRHGLLAGARRFRRRPCPPRFLAIGLAARLLAPRPRVLLVFILARGGGRRLRLLIGDAGLALQRFAALAFDRADAGGVLGKFRDQFRRHADIVGRLTSDRHIPPQRRAGRRVQRAVGLAARSSRAGQARSAPSGPVRANWAARAARLAASAVNVFSVATTSPPSRSHVSGSGEGLQILDARSFAALGGDLLELGLLAPCTRPLSPRRVRPSCAPPRLPSPASRSRPWPRRPPARPCAFPRSPCARRPPPWPSVRLPPPWPVARWPRAAPRLPRRHDPFRPVRLFAWLRRPCVRLPRPWPFPRLPPPWRGARRLRAFRGRGLLGLELLRLALGFLRGLARRLALGARLLPRAPAAAFFRTSIRCCALTASGKSGKRLMNCCSAADRPRPSPCPTPALLSSASRGLVSAAAEARRD